MAPIAFSCRQPPCLLEMTSLLPVSDVTGESIGYMFRELNDSADNITVVMTLFTSISTEICDVINPSQMGYWLETSV